MAQFPMTFGPAARPTGKRPAMAPMVVNQRAPVRDNSVSVSQASAFPGALMQRGALIIRRAASAIGARTADAADKARCHVDPFPHEGSSKS